MPNIFLVGHTGSINRGCEAIVRSTVKLLKNAGIENIILCSTDPQSDLQNNLNEVCEIRGTRCIKTVSVEGILGGLERRILHKYSYTEYCRNKEIIHMIEPDDIVFVIGGDTYCYEVPPYNVYVLNRYAKKRGAKTVLWACSIEKERVDDEMLADFERYDYIVPRESLSAEALLGLGLCHPKILQCSDPAFFLDVKKPAYCRNIAKNTIGINISPIIRKKEETFRSILSFIELLLKSTEDTILLIPHVYDKERIDSKMIQDVQNHFKHEDRVCAITENLNCEELKFYISQCTAFVGCRTHSTIAAYSSGVPTLVLGYSVKSKGIATDLFGQYEGYVLMYDCITSGNELYKAFMDEVYTQRETLSNELKHFIPEYRDRTEAVIKRILGDDCNDTCE